MSLIFLALATVFAWARVANADTRESFSANWTAEYYNNTTLSGAPVWVETLSGEIDFFYGYASLVLGIVNEDDFSIRFSTVRSFDEGLYKFWLISDDGMRIFINGVSVYDEFVERSTTQAHFTRIMTAGTHDVVVEYFEAKGGAVAWFMWLQTGTLNVTLDLLDRPPKPHPSWQTFVHMLLMDYSGASPILDMWSPTDQTGTVYPTEIRMGAYRLWVKSDTALARAQTVTLVAGENAITVNAQLREGDADGNGLINITDFSLLATPFGKLSGQAGFNIAADFNNDGIINITDFSLLATSFGQSDASP